MRGIGFRFNGTLFAIGTGVSSLGAGVAQLVAGLTWMGTFLFLVGLPIMAASLLKIQTKPVTTYDRWDTVKICEAMRRASDDAVIRIRQTWIPEEGFVNMLRDLYVNDDKRFNWMFS